MIALVLRKELSPSPILLDYLPIPCREVSPEDGGVRVIIYYFRVHLRSFPNPVQGDESGSRQDGDWEWILSGPKGWSGGESIAGAEGTRTRWRGIGCSIGETDSICTSRKRE